MTIADAPISRGTSQHIVLDNVSWKFYEQLLAEIGNGHLRVTFDEGRLEIMSPLPSRERYGARIARLIELMCTDREMDLEPLGSTTFKLPEKAEGLEPDECYYVRHAAAALEMAEAFDAKINPPPDLAVEIDITSRSVPREPIYAALGVPEIWRFDGIRLRVMHLSAKGKYLERTRSLSFPFLPMGEFGKFIARMNETNKIGVLREFRAWIASLPS